MFTGKQIAAGLQPAKIEALPLDIDKGDGQQGVVMPLVGGGLPDRPQPQGYIRGGQRPGQGQKNAGCQNHMKKTAHTPLLPDNVVGYCLPNQFIAFVITKSRPKDQDFIFVQRGVFRRRIP